MKEGPSEPLYR